MAQNTVVSIAAAVGTGVMVKALELGTPLAGVAACSVFALCVGVGSLMKVDVKSAAPKAKKMSKKEKRALAAANAPDTASEDAAAAAKAEAKALKKRAKEQARKATRRAAAAAEKEAAAKEEKQKAVVAVVVAEVPAEKKLTAAQLKKKKQKAKAKAKKAASSSEAAPPQLVAAPAAQAEGPTGWEEVKQKKGKKVVKAEDEEDADAPAFTLNHYVERKYFKIIIGTGGANLRSITEATNTQIDLPKEGGMAFEISISGPEAGCRRAQAAIDQLVAKGYCDLTHAGTVDTLVDVPENKRGIVIGPKGSNLKALQERLGVKINFPEKGSEDGVTIVGEAEAIKKAAAAIKMLVEEGYSDITHENYIKANVEVVRDLLKNLIGPGGATIKGIQKSCNVNINIPSEKSGETVVLTVLGEAEGVAEARVQILALMVPPEPTPIAPEWQQQASLQHVDAW